MNVTNIEELEEALEEILGSNFRIEQDKKGQIVIFTGLTQDDDGELLELDDEEEDIEFDEDSEFEPLEDEDDDEE